MKRRSFFSMLAAAFAVPFVSPAPTVPIEPADELQVCWHGEPMTITGASCAGTSIVTFDFSGGDGTKCKVLVDCSTT